MQSAAEVIDMVSLIKDAKFKIPLFLLMSRLLTCIAGSLPIRDLVSIRDE